MKCSKSSCDNSVEQNTNIGAFPYCKDCRKEAKEVTKEDSNRIS